MPPSKTKIACRSCNLRRVRCDRTDETPCSRCRTTGQDCEPIVSKRGKHKRGPVRRSGFRHSFDPVPDTPESATEVNCLSAPTIFESSGSAQGSTATSPAHPPPIEPQSGRTIYYGDYFNLEYTRKELDDSHEDYNARMNSTRFAHVDRLGSPTRRLVDNHSQRERARLDEVGAFDTLEGSASDKLVHSFFELIYPVTPIIDRKDFYHKFKTGRVSPLLLQALYMVAILHCEPSTVAETGLGNRYMAAFTCYHRAKALYDAGYESDAITVIQALLCLSFWWETPTQQKDMWYWTGIGVSLAQSLGMHQEETYLSLDGRKRKLWRRLWWTIYSHDISIAVQLRRTPHVNDGYCTTRLVAEQDFDDDDDPPERFGLGGNVTKEARLQTIYLADLCLRVSSCHRSLYNRPSDPSMALGSIDSLAAWNASLPVELQCRTTTFTLQNGFFARVLSLTYYCFEIILRRNHFRSPQIMAPRTPVFEAAIEIVRILEDILTSDLLSACPLRVLPPTFAALSVLIANMRRPASGVSAVSVHRAQLCMLVLSKLIDCWPPGLLYYRLFARILAARGCMVPDEPAPSASTNNQRIQSPSTVVDGINLHTTGECLMSDTMPGEADLIGLNSLFPLSAFLHDEFLENDLNLLQPTNNDSLN